MNALPAAQNSSIELAENQRGIKRWGPAGVGTKAMPRVHKATAIVAIAATFVAGCPASPVLAQAPVFPASTAPTVPVDPGALIGSTVKAFPNGGEPLKLAISDLIGKHPDFAGSVATFLRNNPSLTPAQKQAIFAGLTDALKRMKLYAADLPTKAAVIEPEPGINPWLVALLVAAAGAGIACGFLCFPSSSSAAPVPVPSPN
jgi:hypothetical protein